MFSLNARLPPPGGQRREHGPPAESGHGAGRRRPASPVLFAGRKGRLGQLGPAGNSGARQMMIILDEHRVESEVGAGLLGMERDVLRRLPFASGRNRG